MLVWLCDLQGNLETGLQEPGKARYKVARVVQNVTEEAEYNNYLSLARDRPKPNHRHRRDLRVSPMSQATHNHAYRNKQLYSLARFVV